MYRAREAGEHTWLRTLRVATERVSSPAASLSSTRIRGGEK